MSEVNFPGQRPKRCLSEVLKLVKCPLTWIEDVEILKDIPEHILRPFDSIQAFVKNLLDTQTKDILGDDEMDHLGKADDEEEVLGSATIKETLHALNIAALWGYAGRMEESQKWLQIARELSAKMSPPEIRDGQRSAVIYLLEALQWSVEEHQRAAKDQGKKVADVEQFSFLIRREELKETDDGAKAVLKYCKIHFGELLMLPEEKVLKKLKKIVDMDPDYYEWHQDVYHLIRKIRMRNEDSGDALMMPCVEEMDFCEKAYSLAQENFQCIFNVALLIKDGLWTLDKEIWDAKEDEYLLCVKLFREALRLATEKNQKRKLYKIKIYLAEVLIFGRGLKLQELQDEGRSLMEECKAMYPNSSLVFYTNLPKCTINGTFDTGKFRDQKLAKIYYQRSLKEWPQNFECVMDYMKLMRDEAPNLNVTSARKVYREILDTFQKCRVSCKVDYQIARLDILEGSILWIFMPGKREEACRVWIRVLKNWPQFRDALYTTMKTPPFFRPKKRRAFIYYPDVIAQLKEMQKSEAKIQRVWPQENLGKTISAFMTGLLNIVHTKRQLKLRLKE